MYARLLLFSFAYKKMLKHTQKDDNHDSRKGREEKAARQVTQSNNELSHHALTFPKKTDTLYLRCPLLLALLVTFSRKSSMMCVSNCAVLKSHE